MSKNKNALKVEYKRNLNIRNHKNANKLTKNIIIDEPRLSATKLKRKEYYKKMLEREHSRKPSVCKYFLYGCCKIDDCTFSHDVTADQMKRFDEPCRYYPNGECTKGEMCLYMHGNFPCQFFHSKSSRKCLRGEKCLFSHNPLTEKTALALKNYLQAQANRGLVSEPDLPGIPVSIQPNFGKSIIFTNNTRDQSTTNNSKLHLISSSFGKNNLLVPHREFHCDDDDDDNDEDMSDESQELEIETKSTLANEITRNDLPMENNQSINLSSSSSFSRLFSMNHDQEDFEPEKAVIKKYSQDGSQSILNVSESQVSNLNKFPTFTRFSDDSDSGDELKICDQVHSSIVADVPREITKINFSGNLYPIAVNYETGNDLPSRDSSEFLNDLELPPIQSESACESETMTALPTSSVNWSIIPLILPSNISYHEMDIDCYRLPYKFDDPRLYNHPQAIKCNWEDWLKN